ncbi:hypothetical protein OA84_02350 [Kaistella solincola]|uniref:Uncharacterized protein n=1 Tax=Kaistella solincola TaxID=510955 RepID=A0ABR4ZSC2_9FLAO|nr:hypothetical protein OA84_02350 [Kaistella solincola]
MPLQSGLGELWFLLLKAKRKKIRFSSQFFYICENQENPRELKKMPFQQLIFYICEIIKICGS